MGFIPLKVLLLTSTIVQLIDFGRAAKIVDFGPKLSEFVYKHPDKGFLIKFYTPWCHYCQQLEPVYINTAEQLYKKHNNLVVGQVDCTHSPEQCTLYEVQAFPEILYITRTERFKYEGDRSLDSLISFADRVHGPDVNHLQSCKQLKDATNKYGVVFVSSIKNQSSGQREEYFATAKKFKAHYWFYQLHVKCDNFIQSEGVYLSKRHSSRPILYNASDKSLISSDDRSTMERWVELRSFPIYGQLLGPDLDHLIAPGKHIVVTLLDFYQPASKFTPSSNEFHKSFEKFARVYADQSDDFIFAWTSDVAMIETVALRSVIVPNIMIIAPDLSYHLLLDDPSDLPVDKDKKVPKKLKDYRLLESLLDGVKSGSIYFQGGNGPIHNLYRMFYRQYIKFRGVYRSEPILATVLMALPTTIFAYILYIIISDRRHVPFDDYQPLPQNRPMANGNITSDRSNDNRLSQDEDSNSGSGEEESTKTSQLNEDHDSIESLDELDQETFRRREA